jgi:hypothetical protein
MVGAPPKETPYCRTRNAALILSESDASDYFWKTRSRWRFKAIMTPMRANIVGPPDVATRIRLSIAACHSAVSAGLRRIANEFFDKARKRAGGGAYSGYAKTPRPGIGGASSGCNPVFVPE